MICLDELMKALVDGLRAVIDRLDLIIESNNKMISIQRDFLQKIADRSFGNPVDNLGPDAVALLSLPSSLRKTAMVLYKLNGATAEEIAKETGRLRAVESSCANQLVRMGYVKKKREGRKVRFFI